MRDRLPELLDAKGLQAEPTTVYIARGKRGIVLYVGITGRNLRRMHAHARASAWWPLAKRLDLRHLNTVEGARALERELIQQWEPEFNTTHKPRRRVGDDLVDLDALMEHGYPRGFAKAIMRCCPPVAVGRKTNVRVDDVRDLIDANTHPPRAA